MSHRITMYSTGWCADCRNAKRFLAQHGISYTEVDIDTEPGAARQVIEWSGGRRVIPTFFIARADGGLPVILHNPRHDDLAAAIGITA